MKNLSLLFFLFIGLFLVSCDDDTPDLPETNTIVDIAAGDNQFSTLVEALTRVDLVSTLQGDGPFTVFAPTNDAFTALGVDLATISDEDLTDILLYHVLGGEVRSTDLGAGQTYASTASASGPGGTALSILIENDNGVSINNVANVTTADVVADNGVIHIVDAVIMPLSVVGHASANSNFTSLVSALAGAPGDLVGVLSGDGPFTVFAPVNTAFDDISSVIAGLTPEQLATVLTYHVVAGANVTSGDLSNGAVATVAGQDITIDLSDGVRITDATGEQSTVVLADVQATNGVIHVLDRVLLADI
jgi:uncharacterized surface protein with fasciclin (FAS1) repeats